MEKDLEDALNENPDNWSSAILSALSSSLNMRPGDLLELLGDVLPAIGLDRILLETDSPYLAPVPHRGKRNESSFLPHVASYVGDALGVKTESVAEATTKNACDLFSLKI